MTDNLTPEQRSYAMARIHSRGNSSTELALVKAMRQASISGWRRNIKICGSPDFVFPRYRIAVFVDGCYWHGCRKCGLESKSNREYWLAKIERNRQRDKENSRELRRQGWVVVRFWEHNLKDEPANCIRKLRSAIKASPGMGAASPI